MTSAPKPLKDRYDWDRIYFWFVLTVVLVAAICVIASTGMHLTSKPVNSFVTEPQPLMKQQAPSPAQVIPLSPVTSAKFERAKAEFKQLSGR